MDNSQDMGDHALRPFGLSRQSLLPSQAKPAAAIAVGFTGTQEGLNGNQKNALSTLLEGFRKIGAIWMHNGDCIGADEFAGRLWLEMGGAIHLHPPTNNTRRAFLNRLPMVVSSKPRSYLLRNQDIVLAATAMIATPKEMAEQQRGGTWYTVRAARHRMLPLAILRPDRTITWERWPDKLEDFARDSDATRIPAPYPCPTCGVKHPFDNVFCSDGYHSPDEPYASKSLATKVVPVTLTERTVAQIDVLGPRSTVIRQIVEEYCAERATRGIAIAAGTRSAETRSKAQPEGCQSVIVQPNSEDNS